MRRCIYDDYRLKRQCAAAKVVVTVKQHQRTIPGKYRKRKDILPRHEKSRRARRQEYRPRRRVSNRRELRQRENAFSLLQY